jgi:hypothetical protein
MAEELVDPSEYGLWISASAEPNGKGERMKIPSSHVEAVLDALRTAAAARADYALNAALLKWQHHPHDVPGLMDVHDVESVLTMVEGAAEALRVLREVAGEVVDPDA